MKRIILAAQIYPPEIGGAATYFSQLENIFRGDENYKPLILTEHHPNKDLIEFENDTPIVRVCPKNRGNKPAVKSPLEYIRKELDFVGDIIHIHPHLNAIKDIFNASDDITPPAIYDYRGVSNMISSQEYNSTDVCLSVSEGVDEALRDEYNNNRVIYRAPVVVEATDIGDQHSTENKTFRCIFVAGLHQHKGLDIAVKAVRSINNVELVIVGDGPQKNNAQIYDQKYKEVQYLGRLPHSDTLREIDEADVLLAPFSIEADPRVVLEALSLDTPVIGTDVGMIKERVQSAGIITERDSYTFQNSILYIRDDFDTYKKRATQREPEVATKTELKSNLTKAYEHCLSE